MTGFKNQYLVSTDWLDKQQGHPDLRIIDASWYLPSLKRCPYEEFVERHIPGATFFDLDEFSDPSSSFPHMALDPEVFSKKIEIFGISKKSIVIVYDGLGLFSAARLLWLFHLYGFRNVFVLDGGLPKWLLEKKSTESSIRRFNPLPFTISYNADVIVDMEELSGLLRSNEVQIVDARSPERFEGLVPEPRKGLRRGNIPGSINLYYGDLINTDNTLKENDVLGRIIQGAGIDLEKRLIASCGSGVTAAILYIVFKSLGAKRVSVYDGSWCEWGSIKDPDT